MEGMVSLRLSEAQQPGLAEAARRSGLSRSEWLRQLIERELSGRRTRPDPHEVYLKPMPPDALAPYAGPRTDNAASHSRVLKARLRAGRRHAPAGRWRRRSSLPPAPSGRGRSRQYLADVPAGPRPIRSRSAARRARGRNGRAHRGPARPRAGPPRDPPAPRRSRQGRTHALRRPCAPRCPNQSSLMPARLTTPAHFSISAPISARYSSLLEPTGSMPSATMRSRPDRAPL